MNSASMATNLLGRPVRLRDHPEGTGADTGTIVLVAIDEQGVHFLVLVGGRLVRVEGVDQLTLLD